MQGNRPIQARVSNHGTWLWTWYGKKYDPSYAINTCVIYSKNGKDDSDVSVDMRIVDKEGNVIGKKIITENKQYNNPIKQLHETLKTFLPRNDAQLATTVLLSIFFTIQLSLLSFSYAIPYLWLRALVNQTNLVLYSLYFQNRDVPFLLASPRSIAVSS